MHVQKNEGQVCDAVVRVLENWTNETRADVRSPDKHNDNPPVDLRLKLGTREYAIEHTRMEAFNSQIKSFDVAKRIMGYVKERIPDPFPSSAYYELHIPFNVSMPKSKSRDALASIVDWIHSGEQALRDRNADRAPPTGDLSIANDRIIGTPQGFDYEFELLHWPKAIPLRKTPGALSFKAIPPAKRRIFLTDRLRQAFSKKFCKLHECKMEGARTVLILEGGDLSVTHFDFRDEVLPSALAGYGNVPDEIFLVETRDETWHVWLLKRDENHWPETGMLQFGECYYDPDQSGIPEYLESFPRHLRDAFQLDRMYTPYLPGWAPTTFEKGELDDLSCVPRGPEERPAQVRQQNG